MGPEISIGTCGFSYPEWVEENIYPVGTKSAHMLALYSDEFPIVELNYTWYQMPREETIERMIRTVPPSFAFTAKLTRTMTHDIDDDWDHQTRLFIKGIKPLQSSGKLTAVLLQFPPSFKRTKNNRYYLAKLLDLLTSLPLAVEFRHRSWASDRVFTGLHDRKVTLVTVDAPPLPDLFPCIDVITNPKLFYLRLHGRNAQEWHSGTMQKQFNYSYSSQELNSLYENIIQPMKKVCRQKTVLFNNHVAGQAIHNARTLAEFCA